MKDWDKRERELTMKKIKKYEKLLEQIKANLADEEEMLVRVEQSIKEAQTIKESVLKRLQNWKVLSIETSADLIALRKTNEANGQP